jgi:hypothetical protein
MGRKRTKPKPRTTYVTLDMGRPVTANALWFDPKTGECALLHDGKKLNPKRASADTGYQRQMGHKSLNRVQLTPDKLYANVNRILEQFDFIYAIDTNCKTINSATISVTGVVGGVTLKPGIPKHTAVRYSPLKCIELLNPGQKFENLAWKMVIEMIQAAPNFNKNNKIALIVDSDLSNIEFYNSYSKPIYGEFWLPCNFQLVYASTDSGKENIANQMIALADKSANMIFEILTSGNQVHEYEAVKNQPYSHIRIWEPAHNNPIQPTS